MIELVKADDFEIEPGTSKPIDSNAHSPINANNFQSAITSSEPTKI